MPVTLREYQLLLLLCCAVLSCSVVSGSLRPMDCSPPGTSVHTSLQARILEWVAMPSSSGSSQLRDGTRSPPFQADSLLSEPPGKLIIVTLLYRKSVKVDFRGFSNNSKFRKSIFSRGYEWCWLLRGNSEKKDIWEITVLAKHKGMEMTFFRRPNTVEGRCQIHSQ